MFELKEYKLPLKGKKCKPICSPCKKGFQKWGDYNKHLIEKHGGKSEYKCEVSDCGKIIGTLAGFTTHMLIHDEDNKGCMKHVTKDSHLSHF